MKRIKNRFFLRAYIRAVAAFIVILTGYVGLSVYFIKTQSDNISEIRKNEIKRLVNTAYNMILPDIENYRNGKLGRDEAMQSITAHVRRMTYEDAYGKNYLFMSSFTGTMLVQPFEPEKEGTSQWDLVDKNGIFIIRELVKTASSQEGRGFVTYNYYNPAFGRSMEKMSYVIGIKELECYLGVGLYMDDIKSQWIRYAFNSIMLALLLFAAIFLLVSGIIKPVLRTSEILMNYFEKSAVSPDALTEVKLSGGGENLYTSFMVGSLNRMIERISLYSRKLAGSEEKFRSFFENSADAILFVSEEGLILEANRSALDMFGCSEPAISGITLGSLFGNDEKASQVIRKLKTAGFLKNLEESMVRKNNTEIVVLITAMLSGLYRDSGQILYFIIRDITSEKELEKQLIHKQTMETIGSLAGGIAHDFNNYLGAITGSVSLLRYEYEEEGSVSPERFGKIVTILEQSCLNAARMITQLQSVSGRYSEAFSMKNLNQLARQVADICRNTIDKSVEIRLIQSGTSSLVYADSRIEQVILNMCINASHAMTIMRDKGSPWGGVLTIGVESAEIRQGSHLAARYGAEPGNYEIVSVSDTGVGMTDSQINKIFDPFYTTKPKGQGSGLGLAVAYRTAQQHRGFITAESEAGSGSLFRLYLPSSGGIHENKNFRDQKAEKLSGRIIIIDDEEVFRETLAGMLETLGLEVTAFPSAPEGIKYIGENTGAANLLILDVAMPGLSGAEAYPVIKKIDPGLKILLTSGYGNDPRVSEIIESGIDGFLQKPYTIEKLYAEIRKFF